jgi:hypothetical protein
MDAPVKISFILRVKAFFCKWLCPLCIPARRWPDSRYARKIKVIRDECPFCKAFVEVKRLREPLCQEVNVP